MKVVVGFIRKWIQAHGSSGMSKYCRKKYERSSVYFSLKETSSKCAKKYKIHWQAGYHRELNKNILYGPMNGT